MEQAGRCLPTARPVSTVAWNERVDGGEPERVLFATGDTQPLPPDVTNDLGRYRQWQGDRQALRSQQRDDRPRSGATVALLLVVDRPEPLWLRRCLRAVLAQSYPSWQLSLVLRGRPTPIVEHVLSEELAGVDGTRIVHTLVQTGASIATATAAAADATDAPLLAILDQHDELDPDAIGLLVDALDNADLVYGDEDQIDGVGLARQPVLKPDWSPDLLLSTPYLGRPLLIRRTLLTTSGGIRELDDGDWEHDLMLRTTERTDRVVHLAEVLYHRRSEVRLHQSALTRGGRTTDDVAASGGAAASDGGAAASDGRTASGGAAASNGSAEPGPGAVIDAARRRGEAGSVEHGPYRGTWRFCRQAPERTTVSVIVPFRDGASFLRTCVESLTATTEDVDLQLVLVDNGSVEPETLGLVERFAARDDVTMIRDARPFNWAALNNVAVDVARGEVLLFLNNDIEATHAGWLGTLAAHALRPDVAAVGARLLYPTGQVQHAGVVIGLGGAASHILGGLPGDEPGYLGQAMLTRDCSAVTGACMASRRTVFEEIGGFDEELPIDLNDVNFCLRARQLGYRVVYEPGAELIHYESPSRGKTGSVSDILRFMKRWEDVIIAGDPFLNANLTRLDASCALRRPGEEDVLRQWRVDLESL